MLHRERLANLKRRKTVHSTEDLDRLGWSRYTEIRNDLEPEHYGDYVVIEVDSGDYFVGTTRDEALRRAEHEYPDKVFCLIRVGYPAANKLK